MEKEVQSVVEEANHLVVQTKWSIQEALLVLLIRELQVLSTYIWQIQEKVGN